MRGGSYFAMSPTFLQLNDGWNAEPNDPGERVTIAADTVSLSFILNPWAYEANEGDTASLTFTACKKWRLGPTNDEGWYRGPGTPRPYLHAQSLVRS